MNGTSIRHGGPSPARDFRAESDNNKEGVDIVLILEEDADEMQKSERRRLTEFARFTSDGKVLRCLCDGNFLNEDAALKSLDKIIEILRGERFILTLKKIGYS